MISLHKRLLAVLMLFFTLASVASALVSLRTAYLHEQAALSAQAEGLLELAVSADGEEEWQRLAHATNARLVLYAPDLSLLYDSRLLYDSGGGEAGEPRIADVEEALASGRGESTRSHFFSGKLEQSLCVRLDDGGCLCILLGHDMFADTAWPSFFGWMALILIAALGCSALFAYLSLRPLNYATEVAQTMGSGDVVIAPKMYAYREANQLLSALQRMNNRLVDTVTELHRQSAELDSILGSMINGLIVVDGQMRIVRMNDAARKMLGAQGKVEGKRLLEATGNAKLEASLKEAMETDSLTQVELPVRADQNEGSRHKLIRVYISGLQHDGGPIGVVAMLEDITKMRQLEQMRTDFAANVTHELKTPLTSIKGFVETLQQGAIDDPETARKFLDIIAMEADRLYRLINDVLSLSSMESGRLRAPTTRVSLSEQAKDSALLLKQAADDKQIELIVETEEDCYIQANTDHVRQLLINLIDNAVKYTLNGGKVWVRVLREGDNVILRVKDTGIGIAQEHIPQLFERFYRVDKGRSRSMGGTGLGLAIVKHIVMDMKGQISVESEPGVGTEFLVRLNYDPGPGNGQA